MVMLGFRFWLPAAQDSLHQRSSVQLVQVFSWEPCHGHGRMPSFSTWKLCTETFGLGLYTERVRETYTTTSLASQVNIIGMSSLKVMLPHYNPKNPWAKDEGGCSSLAECERCGTTIRVATHPFRSLRLCWILRDH